MIGDSFLAFPAIRSGQLVVRFRFCMESAQCYCVFRHRGPGSTSAEQTFSIWPDGVLQCNQREVEACLRQHEIHLIRTEGYAEQARTAAAGAN